MKQKLKGRITFRLSDSELKEFKKYSKLHKLKLSGFIRKLLELYKLKIWHTG